MREHGWRRFGRPGGWQQADIPSADDVEAWIGGRLPDTWFTTPPTLTVDRDEILIVGRVPLPQSSPDTGDSEDTAPAEQSAERAGQEAGRIARFREETRDERIRIAREMEHRYGRKVSWGAECGQSRQLFTTFSAPVMTRLRQGERQVLDTLVDAGVARSRSDALAWCVRLVGQHADTWLAELRRVMEDVDRVRAADPLGDEQAGTGER